MATLDKFLFVGDSFTVQLQTSWKNDWNTKYGKDVKFHAKVGRSAYQLKQLLEKKTDFPKESEINGVVLLIGVNNALGVGNTEHVTQCIKLLKDMYKSKKIYVQRVFPVNSDFDKYGYYGGWQNINAAIKQINIATSTYCNTADGCYYIDTTKGFSNNAVLIASKSFDGLHLEPACINDYMKNIYDAVNNANTGGTTTDTNDDTVANGYPPIIKNLLPNTLAGKSYDTSGFEQKFIIIHNMGGGTNKTSYNFWANGSDGRYTSAHYCVEPTEIWQVLEDTWIGHHIGSGKPGTEEKPNPGYDAGARNNNSFGIEMADGDSIDKEAALENTIELTRYLMKTYDIPLKNIYNHQQVSGADHTDCPWWILKNKKWDYFLQEVEKRNKNNDEIKLNVNVVSGGGSDNGVGSLPEFDNREDLTNIEQVKGVVLVHMPPYHFYSKKVKTDEWTKEGYDRNFHFEVDSAGFKTKVDNNLITWGMQSNDKHTYIDRALFKNKPYKYVLNIGLFTSEELQDYTVTEKILIDRIGKVLWDNGLETKDLWREFDLNRAPSPFMYLEREQWKKFLREVDKQVQWRYENFGTPPVIAEKEDFELAGDSEQYYEKIGRTGWTWRQCSLWKNPEENIDDRVTILKKNIVVEILDFDQIGMYKVKLVDNGLQGWIWASSLKFEELEEDTEEEVDTASRYFNQIFSSKKNTRDNEGTEDSDPVEDKTGLNNIPQPEIIPTMTHEEYLKWKEYADPKLIDNFAGSCEPYDKGLEEIINAPITEDDRLNALTEQLDTRNENTIYFNCVEGSPGGDGSHCAKNANELNMLIKPDPYNVDPIYPDLIIPPNYSTVDYNVKASNALPLTVLENENGAIQGLEDYDSSNLFFDYDLLKDKEKKSKGKPVNYLDPYPYDDKIYELENHKPKVKIDEIEARLYDSNHPGDPVAHPIAKNFANVYDMAINQSKKIESRLVRIENTLATVLRNLGRIGSRININCVYYGGQDVFGKYRTIRCMRDDRVHDAGSMTLDQCLCCTRYEPIIGQIYEILDDTGVNGSVMLDNMQMSYMNLDDMKNLNRVERRNSSKKFVNVNREEKETPKKMLEEWENIDQNAYLDKMKKNITSDEELTKLLNNIKQEDYTFKMNWLETDLDLQEPDVKMYPTEGIKAKYKTQEAETPIEDNSITADLGGLTDSELGYDTEADKEVIDETDLDYQEDLNKLDQINKGEWVDTREEADTYEKNTYTSEDYYFEGFNSEYSTFYPGGSSGFGAEARDKIVEMAKKIVQDHLDAKACYSNTFRTTDYTKPQYGYDSKISTDKIVGYDCSSLVSCCYNHAGLKEITNKLTLGIYDYAMSKKDSGAKVWDANLESIKQAKPGDIIVTKGSGHAAIYIGDDQFAHASSNSYGLGKQIRIDTADQMLKHNITDGIFLTPADLVKADEEAATGGIANPDFSGNDVSEQIFNFVKSQGGSDACAAGIVGNAYMESTFQPNLISKNGIYIGLFQWSNERRAGLEAYAKSKGKTWSDLQMQLEWMWLEVTNTKPAGHYENYVMGLCGYTLDEFKNIKSPEEAAALFEHFFERAGNKSKYCPKAKKGKTCNTCKGATVSDKCANIRETSARSAYEKYASKK